MREDGKGFASIMWETWSPKGWFEGDTFGRVAVPFENPDWRLVEFRLEQYGEIQLGRHLAKLVIRHRRTASSAASMLGKTVAMLASVVHPRPQSGTP